MISTLVLATLISAAPASGESVQFFQGDYSEALARASSKKRPLLTYFYTSW